mmetsp:Transcript_25383/g.54139  ORF Transcript_25383/g.54139 Transcript_25383/m.54139 type:complete len:218 (-) Transcript_25383:115-768(-)
MRAWVGSTAFMAGWFGWFPPVAAGAARFSLAAAAVAASACAAAAAAWSDTALRNALTSVERASIFEHIAVSCWTSAARCFESSFGGGGDSGMLSRTCCSTWPAMPWSAGTRTYRRLSANAAFNGVSTSRASLRSSGFTATPFLPSDSIELCKGRAMLPKDSSTAFWTEGTTTPDNAVSTAFWTCSSKMAGSMTGATTCRAIVAAVAAAGSDTAIGPE